MIGWVGDIEKETVDNETFRTVLHTGDHSQLVVMSIEPGDEIGWEAHGNLDQFFRIEQGRGRLDLGAGKDAVDEQHDVEDDWAFIVPAGTWHNVVNTGDVALRLYTIYSPPEHPDGTVHQDKAEADAYEAEHHHHD